MVLATLLSTSVSGAEPPNKAAERANRKAAAREAATEKRRSWLLDQLAKRIGNPDTMAQLKTKLDAMSGPEIDQAAAIMLEELRHDDQGRGNALLGAARRDQQRHEVERRAQAGSQSQLLESMRSRREAELAAAAFAASGFHPVVAWVPGVTWLPTGASLAASATVFPGGRVRVSAFPFFSSVGPINSFSYGPGYWGPQVYPYGGYGGYPYPAYGQHIHIERRLGHGHSHRHANSNQLINPPRQPGGRRIWYDGLRTRVDPR
jgi:hypothetical protein